MKAFSLTSGADTFDFDIQGNVLQTGNTVGTWTVAADNQITVTRPAGVVNIPVDWGFNTGNQIELRQSGKVIFNFHGNDQVRPDLQIDHGSLLLAPDQNNTNFLFELHGVWDLDDKFNLLFTAGTVKSTIDGILNDTETSQFSYIFVTQAPASRSYELDFTGKWQQNGAGMDVDFVYDTNDSAKPGTIHMPAGLTMDPLKNVLVYSYNKGDHTGSLELAGSIRLNSNFSVTYVLDVQDTGGIQSTTFSIAAAIKTDAVGEGNLQLMVKRSGQDQVIQIGGSYHGAVAGNDLTVGFSYKRTVSGTAIQDSVAFTGKITNPANGNTFQWAFTLNGSDFTIDLSAQIAIKPGVCFTAALNVTVNGQQMSITAMFGISTSCAQAQALAAQRLSPARQNRLKQLGATI